MTYFTANTCVHHCLVALGIWQDLFRPMDANVVQYADGWSNRIGPEGLHHFQSDIQSPNVSFSEYMKTGSILATTFFILLFFPWCNVDTQSPKSNFYPHVTWIRMCCNSQLGEWNFTCLYGIIISSLFHAIFAFFWVNKEMSPVMTGIKARCFELVQRVWR